MRLIYGDDFFSVEVDPLAMRIELIRTKRKFPHVSDLVSSLEAMMIAVTAAHAEEFGVLVDLRAAPQLTETAFQRPLFHLERFLSDHFSRVAIVYQSPELMALAPHSDHPGVHYVLTLSAARRTLAALKTTASAVSRKN